MRTLQVNITQEIKNIQQELLKLKLIKQEEAFKINTRVTKLASVFEANDNLLEKLREDPEVAKRGYFKEGLKAIIEKEINEILKTLEFLQKEGVKAEEPLITQLEALQERLKILENGGRSGGARSRKGYCKIA